MNDLPIAIEIGPLQLHWYGIIIASAVLVAAVLGARVARWVGEDPEDGWSMLLWVVVAAVIGARVYHVIHQWDFYAANPILIPQVWNAGVGIPGAVIGGALAVLVLTRYRGLSTARWLDIFAPALLLGQAVGRLGNFVNQELYGPPVTECGQAFPPCLPWGIQIDAGHRVAPWNDLLAYPVETTAFVPLFAYEAVLNLIGMVALLWIIRRFGPRLFAGDIILMYVMWYGTVRSVLETYRTDNWMLLGVPTATWIGAIGLVAAAAWLVVRHRSGWGSPLLRPPETDAAVGTDAVATDPSAGTEASSG